MEEEIEARKALKIVEIFHNAHLQVEGGKVPHTDFYNDALVEETFGSREGRTREFQLYFGDLDFEDLVQFGHLTSLMNYPFAINPGVKGMILSVEAKIFQRDEQKQSLREALFRGDQSFNPYLVLRVNRENIIQDTLSQIMFYEDSDLKKPLKVVFEGEEGIDEGGVRKEYFQVMFRQLLDPNFGMFRYNEVNNTLWFNQDCYETG